MILVYVAGPYSSDPVANTRRACVAGNVLRDHGLAVIVPHLSLLADLLHPRPYEDYLAEDLELVRRCDAVYRLTGDSAGADREVEHADVNGIPVFLEAAWTPRGVAERMTP